MTETSLQLLIVDDNPEDRDLYKRLLLSHRDEWEYRFLEAELGEDGLAVCRAEQPDCVLLDYQFPDLDGLEFLTALASEADMSAIPVIMLTGQGDRSVDLEAMRVGAVDYLLKGEVDASILERAVRYAVEHGRAEAALRESEARFRSLAVSSPIGIFLTDMTGACVYTNPRWQEIAGKTLEESLGGAGYKPSHLKSEKLSSRSGRPVFRKAVSSRVRSAVDAQPRTSAGCTPGPQLCVRTLVL